MFMLLLVVVVVLVLVVSVVHRILCAPIAIILSPRSEHRGIRRKTLIALHDGSITYVARTHSVLSVVVQHTSRKIIIILIIIVVVSSAVSTPALSLWRENDGFPFPCGRVRVRGDRRRWMPRGRKYDNIK